jgi:hypothetical protein
MGLVVFDWLCDVCDSRTEYLVDRREPGWDGERPCKACGNPHAYKVMSAPAVLQASYVDGTKLKGNEDMKKVAKLEVQRASLPANSPERAIITKEIAERRKLK